MKTYRSEIVRLALKNRLPGIFWRGDFADEGGLMAYGVNRLTIAAGGILS